MARSGGFFRRKGASGQGAMEPVRIGDMLPVAPDQSARQVADRVRAIVDAAERNAVEIERFAHADAERIRAEAVAEGEAHVARVRATTAGIERRAAALEEAMGEIISGLGRGAAQLDRELADVAADVAPSELLTDAETAFAVSAGAAELETPKEPVPAIPDAEPDLDGARMVALNLSLSGRSRADAAAELGEHYPGIDLGDLLADVYGEPDGTETPAEELR